jgi:hypothetical protein
MTDNKDNKETQLTLELQEPLSNKFHQFKSKVELTFRIFEIKRFSRSWALWFSIIFSIAIIFIEFFFLFTKFSTLPTIVPALRMYTTLENTLIRKDFLFAYPIASITILFTSLYIASTTHNKNNVVALSSLILTTFCIAVLAFSLIDLIAIYNV